MLTIYCPAKVNLFLKILGKTKDNFHQIYSLLAFIDLYDKLTIQKSKDFYLEIDGEFSKYVDKNDNLLTKILDYFVDKFDVNKNLNITLTKNIPTGAGLGGGSSDAAFFMMALNKIFSLNISKKELEKISLNFGSDIAFFLQEKSSLVEERGDVISDFPEFKDFLALLIYPRINLSTKDVFKNYAKNNYQYFHKENLDIAKNNNFLDIGNDLEKSAIEIVCVIDDILNFLRNSKASYTKMSGSGSSCFGIFDNKDLLEIAMIDAKKKFPNFFIREIKISYRSLNFS